MTTQDKGQSQHLRRLAAHIVAQLPNEPSEALQVLGIAADLVRFLDRRDEPPTGNVQRLRL
jgi:hypothetical protein